MTDDLLQGLRAFAAVRSELGRIFARSRGMHTTDAAAIVEVLTAEQRGQPLTPARLAERLTLTTGATSILLNRLEAAGHIVRTREHGDRRIVTLRSTTAVHETADAFFRPLAAQLEAVTSEYSAADLRLVDEVVGRLRSTMAAYGETIGEARPPK